MPPITPTPDQFPKTIYGIHDADGAPFLAQGNTAGWLVQSVHVWNDAPADYTAPSNQGSRVLVRLNNGYGSEGTLPVPARYDAFAQRCGEWVAASRGAHIWIIGNEMNSSAERPNGQPILPSQYASCFLKCRAAIQARAGHAGDQVIAGATAPYNIETIYPGNGSGDWVKYFADVLAGIRGSCDGVSLHCYSRGQTPSAIMDGATYPAPYQNNFQGFLAYRNFMNAVPADMRNLPAYITETQPIVGDAPNWLNQNNGWASAAFAEINTWNAGSTHQPIQTLAVFRWLNTNENWCFSNKPNVLNDLRDALARNFKIVLPRAISPTPPPPPPPPPPTQMLEQAVLAKARSVPWMPVNNTAALWKFAKAHGLQDQQTDELPLTYDGAQYIVQVFNLGIVYVKVGDWGNIKIIPK